MVGLRGNIGGMGIKSTLASLVMLMVEEKRKREQQKKQQAIDRLNEFMTPLTSLPNRELYNLSRYSIFC